MSKIKYYKKSPETKKPIKPLKSIVGETYLGEYKQRLKKVDDMRRTTEQTIKLSEKAFISQFSEETSDPNIDALCLKINEEICLIDSKYNGWGNIIYSCLTPYNDDDETMPSSRKIQKIQLSEEITKAQSNKVQNLVLNWKKLLGSLLDASLFCIDFQEYTAIKIIYIFCKVVLTGGAEIKNLTKVDFDEETAIILNCIAKISLDNWIDEDELIEKFFASYSEVYPDKEKIDKEFVTQKINELADKYRCVEIESGKIRLIEKVLIN